MNTMHVEEKLRKIAAAITNNYVESGTDLDTLVKEARDNHLLSNQEVETLTGMVNHSVFKDGFVKDPLTTFKIAKFENIIETRVDRSMNIIEHKVAMYGSEEMNKTAEDRQDGTRDIDDVDVTPQNAPLFMEAGEQNIDDLRDLRYDHRKEIGAIKNRVIELLKAGESIDTIYGVLRDSWEEEDESELEPFFKELMAELKEEGYLDRDEEFNGYAQPIETEDDEPLKVASHRLRDIGTQIMLREVVHDKIMHKLAIEYPFFALKLETKIPDEYYGANQAINKIAAAGNVASATSNVLIGSAISAGTVGAFEAARSASNAVRKRMWHDRLKTKYPELNQIDDNKYDDIYNSLVGLEPSLLKAPFALKEMILAHDQYGTIDQKTVLDLLGSGRHRGPVAATVGSGVGRLIGRGDFVSNSPQP